MRETHARSSALSLDLCGISSHFPFGIGCAPVELWDGGFGLLLRV